MILFKLYRELMSPALHALFGPGAGCRFEPTCSVYFETAVREHGWAKGTAFGVRRICRCHPLGNHGYDPVPMRRS